MLFERFQVRTALLLCSSQKNVILITTALYANERTKNGGKNMKKLKSIMKRVATVALVFVVAVSFCVPSMTYVKADAKKPRATSVHYYPNDTVPAKERTGIKSFTLDPYTYYNMSKNTSINPSGKSTMKLDDATLERIAVNNIFPKWGVIAESFFRDQADQLVTIEGSGMMSNSKTDSNSFDKHFSFDRQGVDDSY